MSTDCPFDREERGTSSLVTRGKEENTGAGVLRSVGLGVGRRRFLKVIRHEVLR